ncbi:MAG: DUF2786 domain-containing protein [Victivallales bacterium]|nr:DUF2786 domain-containing protein [Victivallales bacterium]
MKEINKIKKLLALSQSNNENEAAVALARAVKLCAEHGLSIEELEASGMGEQILEKEIAGYRTSIPQWESIFRAELMEIFGCRMVYKRRTSFFGRRETALLVVGFSSDIEIFKYVYEYLLRQIKKFTATHMKSIGLEGSSREKYRRNYLLGMCHRVVENAKAIYQADAEPEAMSGYGLILKRGGVVDKHLEGLSSRRRSKLNIAADPFLAGVSDANQIALRKGMETEEARPRQLG